MTDQARIKLAEAMGFIPWRRDESKWQWWEAPDNKRVVGLADLPDPFTDANDDYAVLEWFRENYGPDTREHRIAADFYLASEWGLPAYQKGDHARNISKALGIPLEDKT